VRYGAKSLRLAGAGTSPADGSALACIVGDRAYQAEVTLTLIDGGEGGLLLFYSPKAFVGLGFTPEGLRVFQYAEEQTWARQSLPTRRVRLRLTYDHHVVTWHHSHDDGRTWKRLDTRMEVSGLHHNVFGGFLSLRVALYSAGQGAVEFSDFRYHALAQ